MYFVYSNILRISHCLLLDAINKVIVYFCNIKQFDTKTLGRRTLTTGQQHEGQHCVLQNLKRSSQLQQRPYTKDNFIVIQQIIRATGDEAFKVHMELKQFWFEVKGDNS